MADADDRSEIAPAYASAFPSDDLLAYLESCNGCIVRSAHGRRTFRFTENGRAYFAKVHTGVGWGEIIKNLTTLRLPVISAANEWRASHRIASLGVRVPTPVAYGVRGRNPARLRSYLITEALDDTLTLEQVAQHWRAHPPPARLKHAVIDEVARIARTLHENGINHRDFYLCHFRIGERLIRDPQNHPADRIGLILMDLHRVQMRRHVPRRWREKDLAGLLFSAMDAPLSQRDVLRFVKRYRGERLRRTLRRDARLWRAVQRKAKRLYRSKHDASPPRQLSMDNASADVDSPVRSGDASPPHAIRCIKEEGGRGVWLVHPPGEPKQIIKTWTLTPTLALKGLLGIAQPQRQYRGTRRLERAGMDVMRALSRPRVRQCNGCWFVMLPFAYRPGRNLYECLRGAPVGEDRAAAQPVQIAQRVGRMLADLYRVRLFHRDFKPTNLLMGEDDGAEATRLWMLDATDVRRMHDPPGDLARMLETFSNSIASNRLDDRIDSRLRMAVLRETLRPLSRTQRHWLLDRLRRQVRTPSMRHT